jgi:hypothetical protein
MKWARLRMPCRRFTPYVQAAPVERCGRPRLFDSAEGWAAGATAKRPQRPLWRDGEAHGPAGAQDRQCWVRHRRGQARACRRKLARAAGGCRSRPMWNGRSALFAPHRLRSFQPRSMLLQARCLPETGGAGAGTSGNNSASSVRSLQPQRQNQPGSLSHLASSDSDHRCGAIHTGRCAGTEGHHLAAASEMRPTLPLGVLRRNLPVIHSCVYLESDFRRDRNSSLVLVGSRS